MPTQFRIPLPSPFHSKEFLRYLGRNPIEPMFKVNGETLSRLHPISERDSVFIEAIFEEEGLVIQVYEENIPTIQLDQIRSYYLNWMGSEVALDQFYSLAQQSVYFAPLTNRFYGLRIPLIPDLFEAICWTILGQQINLSYAYTLKSRLVGQFGEQKSINDQIYFLFPKPEIIADLQIDALKNLGISTNKSKYLIDIAQRFVSGEIHPAELREFGDFNTIRDQLLALKGIGPWSADYILMKAFGFTQAFPIGDAGLQNALKQIMDLPNKPEQPVIEEIFQKIKGWEAYGTFYLWQTLLPT